MALEKEEAANKPDFKTDRRERDEPCLTKLPNTLAVKEKRWYPGLPYETDVVWSITWEDLGRCHLEGLLENNLCRGLRELAESLEEQWHCRTKYRSVLTAGGKSPPH